MTFRAATLCALALALPAVGAPASARADDAPRAAAAAELADGSGGANDAAEGSGEVPPAALLRVHVRAARQAPDAAPAPLGDTEVRVHILAPPHSVVASVTRTTDAAGEALVEIAPVPGARAYAEVEDGRRFFSAPVAADAAGDVELVVDTFGVTHDPSVIRAETVSTIAELWEGYVTFTQVWSLAVSAPVIYAPEMGNPASFAPFPMAIGAEGIHVIEPEGLSRVVGEVVWIGAEVAPPGVNEDPARLVVQFSLPLESDTLTWTQPFTRDVDHVTLGVAQTSAFERFPSLDVSVDVPMCGSGAVRERDMCFAVVDDDPTGLPIRERIATRTARGSARAGQDMRVTTRGWPTPTRWERPAGAAVFVVALLGAIVVVTRGRRRVAADGDGVRADLHAQRAALLAAAAELEADFRDGQLVEQDYAIARERVRQQLGVVYRRLRELGAE
ncbi:MAG: hypothetical protein H6698_09495 [Myxococcales bacterium]|nr:hypothetical protein [Myxococcales bacterium]MCB9534515.1 hypothetical protein [Myxococcales bacterium]